MKIIILILSLSIGELASFGLIQDEEKNSLPIVKSKNGKRYSINRFDRIKIIDTMGVVSMGYFYENNETGIVMASCFDAADSIFTAIPIDRIKKIHLFKSKPETRAGNILIVSGIIISATGLTAFILGSVGNSTNSNFIFDQGSMAIGGLSMWIGLLQVLIGKEIIVKTFKISSGKYELVDTVTP